MLKIFCFPPLPDWQRAEKGWKESLEEKVEEGKSQLRIPDDMDF